VRKGTQSINVEKVSTGIAELDEVLEREREREREKERKKRESNHWDERALLRLTGRVHSYPRELATLTCPATVLHLSGRIMAGHRS